MPRAVVVTKLDHARADHDGVVAAARSAFGEQVRSVLVPVGEGELSVASPSIHLQVAANLPDREIAHAPGGAVMPAA